MGRCVLQLEAASLARRRVRSNVGELVARGPGTPAVALKGRRDGDRQRQGGWHRLTETDWHRQTEAD
eukprot:10107839-Alexandrium_andersonii.AAC.1